MKRSRLLLLVGGVPLVAFGVVAKAGDDAVYAKLAVFARVLHTLDRIYVEPVKEGPLVEGAIRGMVGTLDEHSAYFTAEELRELTGVSDLRGGGVGMSVVACGERFCIGALALDGPAARAGLLEGDVVVEIGGRALRGRSRGWIGAALEGLPGSNVALLVDRPSFLVARRFVLTRLALPAASVESEPMGPFAYVLIRQFSDGSARAVDQALRSARRPKGIILDLRDNPGGLVDQAAAVVDLFVDDGTIVTTEGRGGNVIEAHRARAGSPFEKVPLVVLVNGASASAAEIVASALLELGRATLVGARTFGKGSVQSLIELEDGSALKVTTARYFTPQHHAVQTGIVPQELVPAGGEPIAAPHLPSAHRKDRQLAAALLRLSRAPAHPTR